MGKLSKRDLPRLSSARFHQETTGTYHRISYADVLNPDGSPKPGVEILGVNAERSEEIMVRTPEGLEVFFHWRNDEGK